MSDDDRLTVGWKAGIVSAIVIGVVALVAALRPASPDPQVQGYQERIAQLERQIAVLKMSNPAAAKTPASDMGIGE